MVRPSALLLVVVFTVSASGQATLLVPEQFPTIQAAIDRARANDTVSVAAGIYPERLDFKGKSIAVKSREGALGTLLDGRWGGSVVTFRRGEGPATVLEGFTIINGLAPFGGGILCQFASPTVRACRLSANSAQVGGGALYVRGGQPRITRCRITRNFAGFGIGGGGGAFLLETRAVLTNCVFWDNISGLHGGGLFLQGDRSIITNCTVYSNWALNEPWQSNVGNAAYVLGSAATITNCIIQPHPSNPQSPILGTIAAGYSLTYCNIRGWSGKGNYSTSASFIDRDDGDLHLQVTAFDRGRGTNAAPFLPAVDIDGDPRPPASIDVGADQYAVRLYVHQNGVATPGSQVSVRLVAPSWSPTLLALSLSPTLLSPPVPIPGLNGLLHLRPPLLLLPMPRSGAIQRLDLAVPAALPVPRVFTLQALQGLGLTNPEKAVIL